MSSDRLKANTPRRWADPNPELTYLKYFILLWLGFFAILITGFLIWYVLKPLEARVFIERLIGFIN